MFRNEGFTEFIPKPIERSVLERVLRRVLPESCLLYDTMPAAEQPVQEAAEEETKSTSDTRENTTEEALPAYGSLVRVGVNAGLGLEYCAGDDAFYLEMLRMFHDQRVEKTAELNALYESANWEDYGIKAHALKSTALTIGAEELSGKAKELELAGKRADETFIRENHPVLMQMYEEVCESIAGL